MTDTGAHDADAVRYAVLRKLASGMRHALMGELQALQFSAELAARMLDGKANEAKVADFVRQMPDQARAAVASVRWMIEWVRPEDKAMATVGDVVQQCLRVAGDDWGLRGIEATTDVRTGDARVAAPVLRELLVTSLLALIDTHPGPVDIAISAEPADGEVVIHLRAKRADRKAPFPPLTLYRDLGYDDVATVSRANGVAYSCADGAVTLRLKIVPVAG